jgi:hypothetical protein
MLPLAPAWLSVTTGCPTMADRCWAYSLPTMSAGPPAGKGTIIWIGLAGYSSAAKAAQATKSKQKRIAFFMQAS